VAEVTNNPRWQRGMQSARWTSSPPLRIGSTYEQSARFLGKEIVTTFEVVKLGPGRRMRFVSTAGPFPLDITRTVEPLPAGGARFTEHVAGDANGFYRVATPVLRSMVRRNIRRDFRGLKGLLETSR